MEGDVRTAAEIGALKDDELAIVLGEMDRKTRLLYEASWHHWARGEQLAPAGNWTTWLVAALARLAPGLNGSAKLPRPTAGRALP